MPIKIDGRQLGNDEVYTTMQQSGTQKLLFDGPITPTDFSDFMELQPVQI